VPALAGISRDGFRCAQPYGLKAVRAEEDPGRLAYPQQNAERGSLLFVEIKQQRRGRHERLRRPIFEPD
jgi:hypothetical protein